MPDVLLDLPVNAPIDRVFEAVSTPAGLDRWWTLDSAGVAAVGEELALGFGPGYAWRARVTRCAPPRALELEFTEAMPDWLGTRVGFELEERAGATWLRFRHTGWRAATEHFRASANCWALYLRVLRRALEHGEDVPYARRLEV